MTRLTTLTQVGIGILVVLLGAQAALWMKLGELSGQILALGRAAGH
jgi:hypothetical protein